MHDTKFNGRTPSSKDTVQDMIYNTIVEYCGTCASLSLSLSTARTQTAANRLRVEDGLSLAQWGFATLQPLPNLPT